MTLEKSEQRSRELDSREIEIARKQLDFEKSQAESSRGFLDRNIGVLITAAVSLAAVIVSVGQVWVTTISKNKEIEITQIQHTQDLESQERQKVKELASNEAQRKRELDLEAAKFITEHSKEIFGGSTEDKELYGKLMVTLFPPEVASPLLHRIAAASTGPSQRIWQNARNESQSQSVHSSDGRLLLTSSGNIARLWSAENGQLIRTFTITQIIKSLAFESNGKEIAIKGVDGCNQEFDMATGQRTGAGC
jgi:WD40 repeat protein